MAVDGEVVRDLTVGRYLKEFPCQMLIALA